jgi:hypothetical protein
MISFCFDFYSVFSKMISFRATESRGRAVNSLVLFVSPCRIFFLSSIKNYQELDTTDLQILKKYLELIIAGKFWFCKSCCHADLFDWKVRENSIRIRKFLFLKVLMKCNQFYWFMGTLFSLKSPNGSKILLKYRVSHIEMFLFNWLWQIEICKLEFVCWWFCDPVILEFVFVVGVFLFC